MTNRNLIGNPVSGVRTARQGALLERNGRVRAIDEVTGREACRAPSGLSLILTAPPEGSDGFEVMRIGKHVQQDQRIKLESSAFQFSGIAWGAGVGVEPTDDGACLVADAAETSDPRSARKLLMKALAADLRCIDAHAHLGNMAFRYRPEDAITRYDIAIRIAELSLSPNFSELLPWGFIFNRPFLRALHGYGLCLWRLDQAEDACAVFERILSLNPADNQGVRFCWNDIRNGHQWRSEK